jgi:hypothetical protein
MVLLVKSQADVEQPPFLSGILLESWQREKERSWQNIHPTLIFLPTNIVSSYISLAKQVLSGGSYYTPLGGESSKYCEQ